MSWNSCSITLLVSFWRRVRTSTHLGLFPSDILGFIGLKSQIWRVRRHIYQCDKLCVWVCRSGVKIGNFLQFAVDGKNVSEWHFGLYFLCCKIGKKDNGQKADLKISPWVCLCVQKSEKKLEFKFFGGDHVEHLEYDNGNGFNAFWCLIWEKNRQ